MRRSLLLWMLLLCPLGWLTWASGPNSFGYKTPEGPVQAVAMEVGPFDLHRRYRSMEGPYARLDLNFGQLLANQKTVVPENEIVFVEGGRSASMNGDGPPASTTKWEGKPALYWVKGLRLDVVDEEGKLDSSGEFICHTNVDVDPAYRNRLFPDGDRCTTSRIFTLTQGQTEITFPDGYGVPVSTDETWTFLFQAANRTTDEHRRVKHLCTVFLVKDSELVTPMTALSWSVPYITVVVDHNTAEAEKAAHGDMPNCLPSQEGVLAPNAPGSAVFTDRHSRQLSGHFVVPPGTHNYSSVITPDITPGFAPKDRSIQLVWSHIHPLCSECSLVRCKDQKPVVTVHASTTTDRGLQLKNIELIRTPKGIPLAGNEAYELRARYDNVTDAASDSMVSMGIFFSDRGFARPKVLRASTAGEVFCGVAPPAGPPLFQDEQDGPLVESARKLEVDTTAGPLHFLLDPSLAPRHVTQLTRMLLGGIFDQTPFVRFEPDFVLQLATADQKVNGASLTSPQKAALRRLPLEAESGARHRKGWLTMARDSDKDSAVTSFSILLGDAPHLDGQYTVFGHLLADPATLATMDRLLRDFRPGKDWIRKVTEMH